MAAPWYTFPRIDNFGLIDPAGPYYKPDSNVQVPGDYPVTDVLPGTITSVQYGTSWGQDVITEVLDTPMNQLATHMFFEHLSSVNVTPGERVSPGQLIAQNNPSGAVPLGVGFYSGDVYGSGPAWNVLQQDLAPGGAGLLNPVSFLNELSLCNPLDAKCNPPPGFPLPGSTGNYPPGYGVSLPSWITDSSVWFRVGIVTFGVLIVLVGVYKLF